MSVDFRHQRQVDYQTDSEPLNEVLEYLALKGKSFETKEIKNCNPKPISVIPSESDTLIITSSEIILPRRKRKA